MAILRLEDSTNGQYSRRGLLRRDDGVDFEVNDVVPVGDPFVEIGDIGRFHQLKASLELLVDPARNVFQSFRSETAALTKAPIDWNRIAVLKMFDNHIQQSSGLPILLL